MIRSYFSAFIAIDNHNMIHKSYLVLDKYQVTQSEYFRIATMVALCMGITDGKLLFCHGISEQIKDKKISMREYNYRTVYY